MIGKTTKNVTRYATSRCAIEITTIPSGESFKPVLDSILIDVHDDTVLYISGKYSCEDFIELVKQISSEY